MHGVREEGLQRPSLKSWLLLQSLQHLAKHLLLLAFCQDLQTEVMIPHVFLVDHQHRQQHVKQVSYTRWGERE